MYTKDRIVKGSEITKAGAFTLKKDPFYIFLVPKNDTVSSIVVVMCQLSYDQKTDEPFPIACGYWNPVVFNSITITTQMLSNYRIFWGVEK